MGAALTVTRTDHSAAELRSIAGRCRDAAQVRRLLALASVLDSRPRGEAAAQNGMDRQTLRDWVHRYNAEGIDGLKSHTSPGRAPALTDAQMAALKALVIAGPDPAEHKVVRWRCSDLQAEVARRFAVEVHESTIGKWLRKLRLTRLQPRPCHPKKVAEEEETFKNFPSLLKDALLSCTAGTPIEIWFQDEARVGQKGTHPMSGRRGARGR
jgi:transposase